MIEYIPNDDAEMSVGMAFKVKLSDDAIIVYDGQTFIRMEKLTALREILKSIRDLARTDLKPDELQMWPQQWDKHRLREIARMANEILEGDK